MMDLGARQTVIKSEDRYWLSENGEPWRHVSQEDFIDAEQRSGFHPKDEGSPLATTSFYSSATNIRGRITTGDEPPETLTPPV